MANKTKPKMGNPRLQEPGYAAQLGKMGSKTRYDPERKKRPSHAKYQELAEQFAEQQGLPPHSASPLFFWTQVMNDPAWDHGMRQRASEQIAKFTMIEPHVLSEEPDPKLINATPAQTEAKAKLQSLLLGLINNQQSPPTQGVTPSPSVHGSGSNAHHPQAAAIIDAELLPPADDQPTSVPPASDPQPSVPPTADPQPSVPPTADPQPPTDTNIVPLQADPHIGQDDHKSSHNAASPAVDRPHSSDPTPQAEAHIGSPPEPDDAPPPEPPTLEELLTMPQGPTHTSADKRLSSGRSYPHAAAPKSRPTELPSMSQLNAELFPRDDQ